MNTNFKIILPLIVTLAASVLYLSQSSKFSNQDQTTVAISQIAPHPSLDKIREGIESALKAQTKNIKILAENAQGNISTASQIAQKFIAHNPALIIPITTPSAQSIMGAMGGTVSIPVIFAAVSDPEAAKLTPRDFPKLKFSGVKDPISAQNIVAMVIKVMKKKNLRIGMIYNPGESNAVSNMQLIKQSFYDMGATLVTSPANKTTDVSLAAEALAGRVDALFIGNDNMVVSALESVLKVADQTNIPVFCADHDSVSRGCTATIAPDQFQMGFQVGTLAVQFLKTGHMPQDIQEAQSQIPAFNKDIMDKLGLEVPEEYKEKALIFSKKSTSTEKGAS